MSTVARARSLPRPRSRAAEKVLPQSSVPAWSPDLVTVAFPKRPGRRPALRRVMTRPELAAANLALLDAMADRVGATQRELQVLRHLSRGRTLAEIARVLRLSVRTVKFHELNLLKKLGLDARVELMRLLL
ncbi:MAG: LuxR C-terminal-related transcriptional regulator [Myxococcota bacterium]